ncbi:LacI family DNA-binding transcriptional regulator [Actinoplanes couchii]|uniref:LacI family transcriptional regulator n=1 Tax=Actinoplanes couchii TaxID=403638 RepID=A0ABQ3XHG8_9ACTN|nr:LacI family DNA-binding transcriptional regulator [Actinoplanes couchii]MDR6317557.1 LacI family transcriptional regulator [Actinoplanes couchii]GID57940.1 LacI family transcriptional regulator [Actinoplanes couchii]
MSQAPRRVTIRDVAARAGVSIATVSRVLGGTYPPAPATRSKVMKAVRELDYVANPHARALSGATSKTIAIVLNSVISPYYAHVAQGVQAEAARHDRLCLIGITGGDAARELATVRLMREEGADAVILVGNVVDDDGYKTRMAEYASALAAAGSQLVLCGRPSLGPDVPSVNVEFDNTGGARAATSHLLSAGHQRILYLGHRVGYTTSEGRIAGYREALAAFGVEHDPGLEVQGTWERAEGYRLIKKRLQSGPPDFTAVFAANDQVAAGALKALRESGLRVPDDISMIGYDDLPPAEDIGLTTVHVPHEELGRTAARMVLERESAGAGHVMLGTHIVVRDSVRPLARPR